MPARDGYDESAHNNINCVCADGSRLHCFVVRGVFHSWSGAMGDGKTRRPTPYVYIVDFTVTICCECSRACHREAGLPLQQYVQSIWSVPEVLPSLLAHLLSLLLLLACFRFLRTVG